MREELERTEAWIGVKGCAKYLGPPERVWHPLGVPAQTSAHPAEATRYLLEGQEQAQQVLPNCWVWCLGAGELEEGPLALELALIPELAPILVLTPILVLILALILVLELALILVLVLVLVLVLMQVLLLMVMPARMHALVLAPVLVLVLARMARVLSQEGPLELNQ